MHLRHFSPLLLLTALPVSAQTVTDVDGNVYHTVTIGGQVWMTENLVTSHYQDGTPIPELDNSTSWFNSISGGARCFFWNDSALVAPSYGALYNWNAVNSPLNVCPAGWHVPSDDDWNTMTMFLDPTVDPDYQGQAGTGTDVGDQLKEVGDAHWDVGNGGTNSSGFTARGAGYRTPDGDFHYLISYTQFWTSTYAQQERAWIRQLDFQGHGIARFVADKLYGASIRCMADIGTAVPEKQGRGGLRLFPNPASDLVRIEGASPTALVTVFDAQGRAVLATTLAAERSIDVQALPSGPYVVQLTDGARTQREVLVKQ